jgi:hypothetical protein
MKNQLTTQQKIEFCNYFNSDANVYLGFCKSLFRFLEISSISNSSTIDDVLDTMYPELINYKPINYTFEEYKGFWFYHNNKKIRKDIIKLELIRLQNLTK